MHSFARSTVEADLERLKQVAERAGWALGCIDVEEHDAWLRDYHKSEDGFWGRMSRACRGLFAQSALIAVFVLL